MSLTIAVIGPGQGATAAETSTAEAVGRLIAEAGHIVVTGGLGGVMAAASKGASAAGGVTIGLLPGRDRRAANAHLTASIPTGLGELRNGLVVRSGDAVICVGGSWGTLSEVALAVRTGVPIVTVDGWALPEGGPIVAGSPEEAVATAVQRATERSVVGGS
jgi:uncharacterized protein (TIGR00725 family)